MIRLLAAGFGIHLFPLCLAAQLCAEDGRYGEQAYFTASDITSHEDVRFGVAPDRNGLAQTLELDLYYPALDVDTASARPLVLLLHGGGFRGGDRAALALDCRAFAERGFVCATAEYRTGFNGNNPLSYLEAVYRAEQDALAALRYLGSLTDTLRLDPEWTFIGGNSAGSVTALNTVYLDQSQWNGVYPGIGLRLGNLGTSGNNLPATLRVRGVFNNWGSTLGAALSADKLVPTIAFHGAQDETVPIDEGPFGQVGSRPIHNRLVERGVCSELTVQADGKHGIYTSPEETVGRISRAACFFKRVACDSCQTALNSELLPADCDPPPVSTNRPEIRPFKFFPNPARDRIAVGGYRHGASFELLDDACRRVRRGRLEQTIDLGALPAGFYFLVIHYKGRRSVERIVKR